MMKTKTEKEVKVSEEQYIKTVLKVAEDTVNKLTKISEKYKDVTREQMVAVADIIYKAISDIDVDKLDKARDTYDFWNDLDQKFNS